MEIEIRYHIYKLNKVMGSDEHLTLEKVSLFNDSYDTEEEAIQALVSRKYFWVNYVILKQVYITNY